MQSAYGSVSAPHANRPPTAFWTILGLACASVVVGAAIGSALSPVAHTSTLYATSTSRPTLARATPALVGTARPYSAPASVAHASVHSARDGSAMEHASAAARERLQERPGLTNAGWLSILTGLVVGAVVYLRRSARPAAPQEPFVCCAATGQQEKEEEDVEMMRGMRWDGANLRWVKDDMAEVRVKYVPETGAAYTLWPVVHTRLTEVGLKSVSPKKALEMMKGGLFGRKAVLLDIRVAKDYSRGRAAGSVSVPLFGPVRGTGMMDNIKRLAMAGFAMEATERNPDFVADCERAGLKKSDTIIVACTLGGTLDTMIRVEGKKPFPDKDRTFGRESRSLKAAYELVQAGYKNVLHLEGGLNEWFYQDLPTECDE